MQGRSGVSASTPDKLILDAGEVYVGIDTATLESNGVTAALAGATKLGATRGGSTFSFGRQLKEIAADGLLGPAKGFRRRQRVAPTLTANLIEVTPENLKQAIAGAVSSSTAGTTDTLTKITGGSIADTDYMTNVALLATYSGDASGLPVIIVLENVLVSESPDMGTSDEDEMVLAVKFEAHFDPAAPDTEPWAIYHPAAIA